MDCKVVLLDEAKRDVSRIVAYLIELTGGKQAARSFLAELRHQRQLISSNPELYGLSRFPELANRGYHAMPVNRYVALYRIHSDNISIDHIFHGSQDYPHLVNLVHD